MIVEMKEDLYLRELSGRKLEVKKCRRLVEGVERGGLKNRGRGVCTEECRFSKS